MATAVEYLSFSVPFLAFCIPDVVIGPCEAPPIHEEECPGRGSMEKRSPATVFRSVLAFSSAT
eukprot:1223308-Pyramimonas_sp.AAC.2